MSEVVAAVGSPQKEQAENDENKLQNDNPTDPSSSPKSQKTTPPSASDNAVENKETGKRPLAEEATTVLKKPVKRARTAYFIFADDRRPEVQKQHVGEGVAAVGRALGQLWATLTPEEKQVYQERAAAERERVAQDLKAWTEANGGKEAVAQELAQQQAAQKKDPTALAYPSARIRKICKLDPEVRGLSKEALLLVTKAAELATAKLGIETVRVAQIQNRRKLLPEDVALVCRSREQFTFLKQDVLDLVKEQQQANEANGTNSKGKKGDAAKSAGPTTANPISSYFTPKANQPK